MDGLGRVEGEVFAELEGIADELADSWIDRFIEEIEQDFVKPEIACVMEQVAVDGSVIDHFDGRTLNPGHAIEGAWFIMKRGGIEKTLT